jgi:hypothetical protein
MEEIRQKSNLSHEVCWNSGKAGKIANGLVNLDQVEMESDFPRRNEIGR